MARTALEWILFLRNHWLRLRRERASVYRKAKELSVVNRAIKYRLYPTTEQKTLFIKTFGCCRKVYNLMLTDRIDSYETTGSFGKQNPSAYKKDYPFLREVDSLALANMYLILNKAFKSCFDKKRKKRNRFPKFKSAKHDRKSYTTYNQNGTVAIIDEKHIKLPKAGKVYAVVHRFPEPDWKLKSVTISQDCNGKFYASMLFEYETVIPIVPITDNAIGLDYASSGLYVDNDGNVGSNHKFFKESQDKLAKEQRRLSHKIGSKKGQHKSKNYLKQLRKVNKVYKHIVNQRFDNLHKLSTEIANRYDVVCAESLNLQSIANGKYHNGKATMDNGYGMFRNMLEYKLAERGKHYITVDKWFPSSQTCHCCGTIHSEMKDLSIRTMRCDCGLVMGRDQNAAINIKKEGLRLLRDTQPK